MNPIDKMKAAAKEGWSTFAPFESFTGSAAPHLVQFAGINARAGSACVSKWQAGRVPGISRLGLDL